MNQSPALQLFIHVEEPSMKTTMEILLPRLLRGRAPNYKVIDHGSKQALMTNLPARLRGYAKWPNSDLRVLVLVDRDADDCIKLKEKLESASEAAGLRSKTKPDADGRFRVVNRIVVEELEAWFLGDVPALIAAYPGLPPTLSKRQTFRDPDAVRGGTWESLHRALKKAGHYTASGRLPKIEVARRVAEQMDPDRNRSGSFQTFVAGLQALLA